MIDNNDIKDKIKQLGDGRFQNLCNKILYNMGYKNINQLGSHDTSDRTTPGTPDTFLIDNGKYICVEYTIQQNGIYAKIDSDIDKCIDEYKKCGIKEGEILYFYGSSNLKMNQIKELSDKCEKYNIKLDIYSIDRIANILNYEYPLIAKEFLGIEIDTLQIISVDEFLQQYNSSQFGVKINKQLLFREDEKKTIIESINTNCITLVAGKSGVGKTHLVLDVCMKNKTELEKYQILCIKNRNIELFNDLKKYIKNDKEYLLIIDDINNINGIEQILYFLDFKNVKIIATVRDYAKAKVISKINEYEEKTNTYLTMGLISIDGLKEEQLIEILKNEKNIKGKILTNKILNLSQKNPRLMMMVADVILEGNSTKMRRTEDIYKLYFKNIINTINETNTNVMNVLGIISILNVIDITNEKHKELIKLLNITVDEFRENMKILNKFEIIDMIDNDTAKVSEQCLANYSIYLILIENKIINFEDLIKILFSTNRTRLVETISLLCSIWQYKNVGPMLEVAVKNVWRNLDVYNMHKEDYLETFARILETEVFNYCVEYVDSLKENKKELKFNDINNSKNKEYCSNYVLKLMSQFKYSNRLDDALTIICEYIKKDDDIISDAYKLFAYNWGFQEEIYYNDYNVQINVISKLKELSQNYKESNINMLLLAIIKVYIKTNGDYTEECDKKSLKIIQYNLVECEQLRELRNIILKIIKELWNRNDLKVYVSKILYGLYSYSYKENKNLKEIILGDKDIVNSIIDYIKGNGLKSDLIIEEIHESYKIFNIDYKEIENFSKEYKLYRLFTEDYKVLEDEDNREKNIKKFVNKIKEDEVLEIIETIKLIEKEELVNRNYILTSGIASFWRLVFENCKINKINILEKCLKNNIVENMPERIIINQCIDEYGYSNTSAIIKKYEYDSKFYWMLECYSLIPEQLINKSIIIELIEFISVKVKISKGHYISWEFLDKYLKTNNNIYVEVLKVIYDMYKNDKFEFSLYTSLLFNKFSENTPQKLLKVFKSDYDILMDSYILLHSYKEYEDFDGTYFRVLINIDTDKFIDKYIKATTEKDSYFTHHEGNCLNNIWKESAVIINKTLKKALEIENKRKRSKILKEIFANQKEISNIQEEYLEKLIVEKISDEDIIDLLFDIISERTEECRIKCINQYLKNNNNLEDFKKISLESMFFSWSGSEVPIIENRIKYYTKINESIKKLGIIYIKHNAYIEEIIDNLQQKKKNVLRKEFIEDWL